MPAQVANINTLLQASQSPDLSITTGRLPSLAGGADFQFLDQRLDRATSVQNVGIELRTFGQER
jgi:hypothetical protein